jgi:HNH endonuclease
MDDPSNVFLLGYDLHVAFDEFDWCLLPDKDARSHICSLCSFYADLYTIVYRIQSESIRQGLDEEIQE